MTIFSRKASRRKFRQNSTRWFKQLSCSWLLYFPSRTWGEAYGARGAAAELQLQGAGILMPSGAFGLELTPLPADLLALSPSLGMRGLLLSALVPLLQT